MSSRNDTARRVIGRRIAQARRTAGLTQGELAAKLAWPRDTLVHYEHGRRTLAVDRLIAIAHALDLPPAALLIEDDHLAMLWNTIVADDRFVTLCQRIAANPDLSKQVTFFLNTLETSENEP